MAITDTPSGKNSLLKNILYGRNRSQTIEKANKETVVYKYGNFGLFLIGIIIVSALVLGARIYQEVYGFSAGLDSMSDA